MKIYWSAFLSLTFLLALAGCGAEQFGVTPQSNPSTPDALTQFQQASCAGHTVIKPKVDILYVVDNSSSANWISPTIKASIHGTINSISDQFDYRVIGTPLLETLDGNSDYQVLARDPSTLPAGIPQGKRVSVASQFSFFEKAPKNLFVGEEGLKRVDEFITAHAYNGLLRQEAYLLVVLVSNGKDYDIENEDTGYSLAKFNARKTRFTDWKTHLNLKQLRILSVTANTSCRTGYFGSQQSYGNMSKALYEFNGLPYMQEPDHFDLCTESSIPSVFSNVNSTIQQIKLAHKYNRWPITFTETSTGLNTASIQVIKTSPTQAPTVLPSSAWYLLPANNSGTPINTRTEPSIGEPTTAKYVVEFTPGNEIVYPDCVQVTSTSNLEYFGYVVMEKRPKLESVVLKINGATISQSSTNGWSFPVATQQTRNIKVSHNGFSDTPVSIKTGYMLKLNGSNNYYKSGDNVQIYYIPAEN